MCEHYQSIGNVVILGSIGIFEYAKLSLSLLNRLHIDKWQKIMSSQTSLQ